MLLRGGSSRLCDEEWQWREGVGIDLWHHTLTQNFGNLGSILRRELGWSAFRCNRFFKLNSRILATLQKWWILLFVIKGTLHGEKVFLENCRHENNHLCYFRIVIIHSVSEEINEKCRTWRLTYWFFALIEPPDWLVIFFWRGRHQSQKPRNNGGAIVVKAWFTSLLHAATPCTCVLDAHHRRSKWRTSLSFSCRTSQTCITYLQQDGGWLHQNKSTEGVKKENDHA